LSTSTKRTPKRKLAGLIAAAMVASVLTLVAAPVAAIAPTAGTSTTSADSRVSGTDRYGTATAAASGFLTRRGNLTTWKDLVVVSGDNYPDALAANGLAGVKNAPIILLPSDGSLPAIVNEWVLTKRDQIQTNSTTSSPFTVWVIGGTSAVPASGVTALLAVMNSGDLTPAKTTRVSGANRAETAQKVAMLKNVAGANIVLAAAKEIFVASQTGFADALSIAPYAFNAGSPVVLTDSAALGAEAKAVLKAYKTLGGTKIVILGGTAAVSDQVVKDIVTAGIPMSSMTRLQGADRYATSAAINKWMTATSVNAANFDGTSVVLVNGENFPDGLAAGPYAGIASEAGTATAGTGRAFYLTASSGLSSSVTAAVVASSKTKLPNNLYTVGGLNAVPASVVAEVTTASTGINTTSTLTCVESAAGTLITLTIPGNVTGSTVGAAGSLALTTSMGNEAVKILNGQLVISGTSNSASPTVAMASPTYSQVTGNTTMKASVLAGKLAKGTVITWSGLTQLANTNVSRVIAGSTCTVVDDKTGPSITVSANIGGEAGAFYLTGSEAIGYGTLDATDITITAAGDDTGCRDVIDVVSSSATTYRYKVSSYDDCNNNGSKDAAGSAIALDSIVTTGGTDVWTSATHSFVIGDKIVCAAIDVDADNDTYYVMTVPSTISFTVSDTGMNGVFAVDNTATADASDMPGTCTKQAENGIPLANADSIVVKTASAPTQACTTVASVAASKVITVTSGTGIAAGNLVSVSGLVASAENGSYYVVSVAGAAITVLRPAGVFTAQAAAGGAHNVMCEGQSGIKDVSDNFGTATVTDTIATLGDTDSTKPILTAKTTCVQYTSARIAHGTYLVATPVGAAGGPVGTEGNLWRMSVVNSRGMLIPTVVVDMTAKTITVTADLAYSTPEDIGAAAANAGVKSWTLAKESTRAANTAMGTVSATTVAAKSTDSGTDDISATQRCTLKVTSNERIQPLASAAVTVAVAINGVAQAFNTNANMAASAADTTISSLNYYTPLTPVTAGTVTTTLTGTIKDTAGNTVTVLALQD
jgi:putative cell wall-binding protein